MNLQHLAAFCSQRVWLMQPEYLSAMYAAVHLAVRSGESPKKEAASPSQISKSSGSVAVLPLHGPVMQRGSFWMDFFGMEYTSTDGFGSLYDAAIADPKVKGIVVDIDSPGGTVGGLMELSDKIYQSRGQKPVVAVANSLAASAAYWLGSSFDNLFVTPGGEVGSVGVYSMHMDFSKMLEEDGVTPTIFQTPAYKAEFNPYQPLSDEAKQHEQAEIERLYGEFVAAVARNRGTTATDVKANYGKGRVMDAKSAVAAGMADRVVSLEKVISRMASGRIQAGRVNTSEEWGEDGPVEMPSHDAWRAALETDRLKSALRMKGLAK